MVIKPVVTYAGLAWWPKVSAGGIDESINFKVYLIKRYITKIHYFREAKNENANTQMCWIRDGF